MIQIYNGLLKQKNNTTKTGILPTTYRSRGFLPCGVGENTSLKTMYASSLNDATSWTYKGKTYKAYGKEDNSYTLLLKELESDGVQVIWDVQLEAGYDSVR